MGNWAVLFSMWVKQPVIHKLDIKNEYGNRSVDQGRAKLSVYGNVVPWNGAWDIQLIG